MADATDLFPPDVYGGTFSADEFARLPIPNCPVCGIRVELDRIDVTLNEAELEARGRRYIAGRWTCPRGCNPLTGERLHGNHTIESGMTDGIRFICNCGFDELVERSDFLAVEHAHRWGYR